MAKLSYLDAILQAQDIAMEKDENVFILGEDVGVKGGVFGATKGLQEKYGVERVFDTPLAESNIVGTAIGASALGKRPIAEIQLQTLFYQLQIKLLVKQQKCAIDPIMIGIVLTIRAPFGGGVHGGLYHSQSIESIFASTPGLTVVIPSSPYDAKGLLLSSIASNDPVLFFEHKKLIVFKRRSS